MGASALLAVAGLLLVRRFTKFEFLESHNEVAGFIYAVIGVIYAVLLAFVVTFVWEQFHAAETRVELEANSLGDLYQDSQAFPEALSSELHRQIRSYAQVVLEAEWPALANGAVSAEAWQAFNEIWATFIQLEPLPVGGQTK